MRPDDYSPALDPVSDRLLPAKLRRADEQRDAVQRLRPTAVPEGGAIYRAECDAAMHATVRHRMPVMAAGAAIANGPVGVKPTVRAERAVVVKDLDNRDPVSIEGAIDRGRYQRVEVVKVRHVRGEFSQHCADLVDGSSRGNGSKRKRRLVEQVV